MINFTCHPLVSSWHDLLTVSEHKIWRICGSCQWSFVLPFSVAFHSGVKLGIRGGIKLSKMIQNLCTIDCALKVHHVRRALFCFFLSNHNCNLFPDMTNTSKPQVVVFPFFKASLTVSASFALVLYMCSEFLNYIVLHVIGRKRMSGKHSPNCSFTSIHSIDIILEIQRSRHWFELVLYIAQDLALWTYHLTNRKQ